MNFIVFQLTIQLSPSFVIARRNNESLMQLTKSVDTDYRRSNLISLMNPQEFFLNFDKNSFTREQREEIAARMQQCLAE